MWSFGSGQLRLEAEAEQEAWPGRLGVDMVTRGVVGEEERLVLALRDGG